MGKKYLIDSNVIIEYLAKVYPQKIHDKITSIIDEDFNISIINKIEVLGHSGSNVVLEDFLSLSILHPADEDVIAKTILLRKSYKITVPDAIIAATAMVNNYILLTRNTSDFKAIKGLKLEDPWKWQ